MNETSDARQTVTLKGVITLMSPLFQVETSEKVVGEDGKQKLILRHRRDKFIAQTAISHIANASTRIGNPAALLCGRTVSSQKLS
jgi:hypothetical protein